MRPGFAQTRFPAQVLPVFAAMAIRSAVLFFIRFHFTALAIRPVTPFFNRPDSKRLAKYKKSNPIGMLFLEFAGFFRPRKMDGADFDNKMSFFEIRRRMRRGEVDHDVSHARSFHVHRRLPFFYSAFRRGFFMHTRIGPAR